MGLILGEKQLYQWHLHVQLWRYGKRMRRVPYRTAATSAQEAINNITKRVGIKGRVCTRCTQGKAV